MCLFLVQIRFDSSDAVQSKSPNLRSRDRPSWLLGRMPVLVLPHLSDHIATAHFIPGQALWLLQGHPTARWTDATLVEQCRSLIIALRLLHITHLSDSAHRLGLLLNTLLDHEQLPPLVFPLLRRHLDQPPTDLLSLAVVPARHQLQDEAPAWLPAPPVARATSPRVSRAVNPRLVRRPPQLQQPLQYQR